jgi:hypothetical protein
MCIRKRAQMTMNKCQWTIANGQGSKCTDSVQNGQLLTNVCQETLGVPAFGPRVPKCVPNVSEHYSLSTQQLTLEKAKCVPSVPLFQTLF